MRRKSPPLRLKLPHLTLISPHRRLKLPHLRLRLPYFCALLLATACAAPEHRWVSTSVDGVVEVSQAYAGESVTGETAAVYFALRNRGRVADTLDAVVVEGAGSARIHHTSERDGIMVMAPLPTLPLPARGVTSLAPGGTHVMLLDLARRPVAGDTLVGVLRFRSGREVSLRAAVHGLTDLEQVVTNGGGRSAG